MFLLLYNPILCPYPAFLFARMGLKNISYF